MSCSQEVADWSWGWEQVGQSIGTEEARTPKGTGLPLPVRGLEPSPRCDGEAGLSGGGPSDTRSPSRSMSSKPRASTQSLGAQCPSAAAAAYVLSRV